MWRASFIRVSYQLFIYVTSRVSSSMSRASFIRVAWLVHTCDTKLFRFMWRGVLTCAMWLVHLCAMTCPYVCHDLAMTCWHGTWLVHARDIAPSYVWHGLLYAAHVMFRCVTCLVHTCHMTFARMWRDSFIRVTLTCLYMTPHLCRHVTWFVQ